MQVPEWDRFFTSIRDVVSEAKSFSGKVSKIVAAAAVLLGSPLGGPALLDYLELTNGLRESLGFWGAVAWLLSLLAMLLFGSQAVYAKRKDLEDLHRRINDEVMMPADMRRRVRRSLQLAASAMQRIDRATPVSTAAWRDADKVESEATHFSLHPELASACIEFAQGFRRLRAELKVADALDRGDSTFEESRERMKTLHSALVREAEAVFRDYPILPSKGPDPRSTGSKS